MTDAKPHQLYIYKDGKLVPVGSCWCERGVNHLKNIRHLWK